MRKVYNDLILLAVLILLFISIIIAYSCKEPTAQRPAGQENKIIIDRELIGCWHKAYFEAGNTINDIYFFYDNLNYAHIILKETYYPILGTIQTDSKMGKYAVDLKNKTITIDDIMYYYVIKELTLTLFNAEKKDVYFFKTVTPTPKK